MKKDAPLEAAPDYSQSARQALGAIIHYSAAELVCIRLASASGARVASGLRWTSEPLWWVKGATEAWKCGRARLDKSVPPPQYPKYPQLPTIPTGGTEPERAALVRLWVAKPQAVQDRPPPMGPVVRANSMGRTLVAMGLLPRGFVLTTRYLDKPLGRCCLPRHMRYGRAVDPNLLCQSLGVMGGLLADCMAHQLWG